MAIAAATAAAMVVMVGVMGPDSVWADDHGDSQAGESGAVQILSACPQSPNCVSSQADAADDQHYVPPIPFDADPRAAADAALRAVASLSRTRVVEAAGGLIRAESRSLVFRFTDDLVILVNPSERVVHFRSASRVGYSDLGANRRRYGRFREAFERALNEWASRQEA